MKGCAFRENETEHLFPSRFGVSDFLKFSLHIGSSFVATFLESETCLSLFGEGQDISRGRGFLPPQKKRGVHFVVDNQFVMRDG